MDLNKIQEQLKAANVSDTWGTKKEIRALPDIISDDETILYATSGMLDGNTVLMVCTDMRVIFIDKGLIYGIKSSEIPLNMVNGVSYSKGLVLGEIAIVNGAKEIKIKNVSKETTPIMTETIKNAVSKFSSQSTPQSSSNDDSVSQLRELKSLVDEGILTQEEFETKKKQVLGI